MYTPTPLAYSTNENDIGYSFGSGQPPVTQEHFEPPVYRPVTYHWFFRKESELWKPFSLVDSQVLEGAYASSIVYIILNAKYNLL